MAEEIKLLFNTHLGGDWSSHLSDEKFWENIKNIPDRELWNAHQALKLKMVEYIRGKAVEEWTRYGQMMSDISADADTLLNPDHLTIGFARRFATYKRAVLIFRDMERLKKILNNPEMPMQIIFSGKAHPKDKPGQEFIKNIFDIARQEGFKGRIFFLEDYDMNVARYLVQGVDVWLNTPRRPYEASGTSGQKGPINGVINFSVLDGWWREAYNINNDSGWSIGMEREYPSLDIQDQEDGLDIYSKLEKIIIPLYYDRDKDGIPLKWVKKMKQSMQTVIPHFSTDRMVKDYTEKIYLKAAAQGSDFSSGGYAKAKNVSAFKSRVYSQWHQVRIEHDSLTKPGETAEALQGKGFDISVIVMLGQLKPQDVTVEIYYRKVGDKGLVLEDGLTQTMGQPEDLGGGRFRFKGVMNPLNGGNYEYTVRAFPFYEGSAHKFEMGLIKWFD
jgi:starch phosphorylase